MELDDLVVRRAWQCILKQLYVGQIIVKCHVIKVAESRAFSAPNFFVFHAYKEGRYLDVTCESEAVCCLHVDCWQVVRRGRA